VVHKYLNIFGEFIVIFSLPIDNNFASVVAFGVLVIAHKNALI